MKIGMIVGHPTQFEGPFFRYISQDPAHVFEVIYTDADRMHKIVDPELREGASWGIDLLSGYSYCVLPNGAWPLWLNEKIKQGKYDLLIINGYSKPVHIVAALLARLHRVPTALRLDSVLYNNSRHKLFFKRVVFSVLFRLYNIFFAVGSLTIEYLKYFSVRSEDISVFCYAVDVEYFSSKSSLNNDEKERLRSQYGIPAEATVILSVAKFSKRESPWDLIKAFAKVESANVWLMLAGDGEERQDLEVLASSLGCTNISFLGYVEYPTLPSIYGIADIFVHPSRDEPWGVSVAEAMACGLPVIASSRVGSAVDLVVPGVNGDLYEFGNPADLKEKLEKTISRMAENDVRMKNLTILSSWDYPRMWQNIKNAVVKVRR